MVEFCHRLKLILWKNYLLRKRQKIRLIVEIVAPILLALMLVWIRAKAGEKRNVPDCHMIPKAMPSVGGYELFQNTLCSISNRCFDFHVEGINHWNSSLFNLVILAVEPVLKNVTTQRYFRNILENLDVWSKNGMPTKDLKLVHSMNNPDGFRTLIEISKIVAEIDENLDMKSGISLADVTKLSVYELQQILRLFCGNLKTPDRQSLFQDRHLPSVLFNGWTMLSLDNAETNSFVENPKTKFMKDPDAGDVCNGYFKTFSENAYLSILWKIFKVYVRGVIYYTPENAFTRTVMEKVQKKIMEMKDIEDNALKVLRIIQRVQRYEENNRPAVLQIQAWLKNQSNVLEVIEILNITDAKNEELVRNLLDRISSSNATAVLAYMMEAVNHTVQFLKCVKYDKIKGFATEDEAVAATLPLISQNRIWAVIVFSSADAKGNSPPENLKYKIRMDSQKVDQTFRVMSPLSNKKHSRRLPLFQLKYITYGFAYLEEMVERAVTEIRTGKSMEGIKVFLQQFPFPCHIEIEYIHHILMDIFPIFMFLSWISSATMMIKFIVFEKEKKLKEMMKMVGLSNLTHWVGWFVDNFVVMFISATLMTAILKFGQILMYSDFFLVLFFLLSYIVSVISLSFLISTFFNRANSAAPAGGLIFFLSYLPFQISRLWLHAEYVKWYQVIPACLLSNVAFAFGCQYIGQQEYANVGAQWKHLFRTPDDSTILGLNYCFLMLWFDSGIYFLLTLYVEAVSPGSGIPKPWNFLFLPSSYSRKIISVPSVDDNIEVEDTPFVEPVPEGLIGGVVVRGLSKTYANGHVALKNLNMDFYQDQITSFLGHNGAGKTTTISILTGRFPPTKGTATVNGSDVTKDIEGARRNIGMCPQFNILFDNLTVSEHIIFFSGLKGKKQQVTQNGLNTILNDLGIPEKRNELSSKLSGGMKRKLCVGIALSGDSKTIFLDEPTLGVDPFSSRSIWELLLKYKQGRTIILTTHCMDEADNLGDRIAIISRGCLKTCGSSLYLKNTFGKGYSLRMDRQQESKIPECNEGKYQAEDEPKHAVLPVAKVGKNKSTKAIVAFVKSRIPDASITSRIGMDISFVLPYASANSFPGLFEDLDAQMYELGVSSYGIADTTLEDVFLEVISDDLLYSDSFVHHHENVCNCFGCFRGKNKERKRTKMSYRYHHSRHLQGGSISASNSELQPLNVATDSGSVKALMISLPDSSIDFADSSFMLESNQTVPLVDATDLNSKSSTERQQGMTTVSSDRISVESSNAEPNAVEGIYGISTRIQHVKQIKAIVLKRFIKSKRSLKSVFFEIVRPVFSVSSVLLFITLIPKLRNYPILEITPYKYPTPLPVFFSDISKDLNITNITTNDGIPLGEPYFSRVIDQLVGPFGLSTECLKTKVTKRCKFCKPGKFNHTAVQIFHLVRKNFKVVKLGSCSCSSGLQECGNNVERKPPPSLMTHTKAQIFDVTKSLLPEWLLRTNYMSKYYGKRVGGFQFDVREPYRVNLTRFLILLDHVTSVVLDNDTSQAPNLTIDQQANTITIWFDNKAGISSIAYLNAFHNMALRDFVSASGFDSSKFGLTLFQHPLPLTVSQYRGSTYLNIVLGIVEAVCVIHTLSYVTASFVFYLIQERVSGGKHLHLVSGVKPFIYFLANFLFDMTKFLIPVVTTLILFIAFDTQDFILIQSIWSFITLLILYGWSAIPLTYITSFLFSTPSTAFVVVVWVDVFIGIVTIVSEFVLIQLPGQYLTDAGEFTSGAYLIFPQYCLGRAMLELVNLHCWTKAHEELSIKYTEPNRFSFKYLGKYLLSLFLQGIIFFILTLVLEYRTWIYTKIVRPKPRYSTDSFEDEDEDVHRERELVKAHLNDTSSMLITERLTKFYGKNGKPVVNEITFGIKQGECFGLFGINGAGKTSVFKMLTGELMSSGGRAMIAGNDVMKYRDHARKHIGYCPQERGLDSLLTATELLHLYGNLKGMKSVETKWATRTLISFLGLNRYANRRCGTYSGGNKRKLSTAIALIGNPDIVFLDEPTSGLDPRAKRRIWKLIMLMLDNQKTVVLATHSIEECEALCTRVAVMVNGRFECLGSTQHLKNRFGTGYMLTVRCLDEKQQDFFQMMQEAMTYAELDSSQFGRIKYKIAKENVKLSDIFTIMHSAREDKLIEEYSISQTSLDDIFVKFANRQKEE